MRKLMRRARSPLQCALRILEKYKEVPDWSMDLGFEARLAKEYTADVYRNNTTARTQMNQWMQIWRIAMPPNRSLPSRT